MLKVDSLSFDSNLFGINVGRIEIHSDAMVASNEVIIHELLRKSEKRLVYICCPLIVLGNNSVTTTSSSSSASSINGNAFEIPGIKVDDKTTYSLDIKDLYSRQQELSGCVYSQTEKFQIYAHEKSDVTSPSLRSLAIQSGIYSRFKVDTGIPESGFEGMFDAWMKNSLNLSLADVVFVIQDVKTGDEIGFITIKKKATEVNIGLLSVSPSYRRQGIAHMLLSRAALWAIENCHCKNTNDSQRFTVVTQGANGPACACYEKFGFGKISVQSIYHAWLPEHVANLSTRSDISKMPFCKQHFTGKELEYVSDVLTNGLDSASKYTVLCSGRIGDILGSDSSKVLMVSSGTAALEMAFLLMDLQPGDEVIMPSYTFSSTANSVVLRGAVPVFVDIRKDTLNIDETLIEMAITERTKAICCVHYAGIPCEMDTIMGIASRRSLLVVEDAAQGFLSTYKGRQLGSIGDFGCFSFHYTKNVICGEGGAISINRNKAFASRALILWEKGTNRYDFMQGKIDRYEWVDVGSSFLPSEASMAILWAQMQQAEKITSKRRENVSKYVAGLNILKERDLLWIPDIPSESISNGHICFIVLNDSATRMKVEADLKKWGITAFSHYVPLHSAKAGLKYCRVGRGSEEMRVTTHVYNGLLRLPVWSDLKNEDIELVIEKLKETLLK